MNFAEAMKNESKWTRTENGAVALNTTGFANLDFFGSVGSLRQTDPLRKTRLFADAYKEDPLTATKILFYGRDAREGLGERATFRDILTYAAVYHPECVRPNLDLIGVYGRYDDLYCLIDTPLEDDMWAAMKKQFEEDVKNLHKGNAVSLLAKWIKTADASSERTRKLGILTAKKLGYPVYNFKRIVRALRKRIDVVESLMSANRWNEIKYSDVPSRAMMIYRKAFMKHDPEGYGQYINKALKGEAKIHSGALYPYDLIEKVMSMDWWSGVRVKDDPVIEAQWRQLPNYVEPGTNAIVIADTSGSMMGRPMATSVGLAIYFAERNTGAYHNMWMSFSGESEIQHIKGETLAQKIRSLKMDAWGGNTNLKAAFVRVLDIAVKGHVAPEDMVKSLIVISDMEIDYCGDKDWTFYDKMQAKFAEYGYQIPNIVFWNVNSRHDIFHADANRKGVQLMSGQSTTVFKQLMDAVGMTPMETMMKVIGSDRYAPITVEGIDR